MSEQENFISKDELLTIRHMKAQSDYAILASESAINKSRVAELTYENAMLKLYIRYDVGLDGGIDIATGCIIEKEEEKDQYDNEEGRDQDQV